MAMIVQINRKIVPFGDYSPVQKTKRKSYDPMLLGTTRDVTFL